MLYLFDFECKSRKISRSFQIPFYIFHEGGRKTKLPDRFYGVYSGQTTVGLVQVILSVGYKNALRRIPGQIYYSSYGIGAAEGGGVAVPHDLFAFGPISTSSKPPSMISLWLNQA